LPGPVFRQEGKILVTTNLKYLNKTDNHEKQEIPGQCDRFYPFIYCILPDFQKLGPAENLDIRRLISMGVLESLYTKESAGSTFPHYIGSIALHSKNLYLAILVIVSLVILSLPFIKVDLYIKASGIIRPGTEKTPVHCLVSGVVSTVNFSEGDRLDQGDVLVMLKRNRKEYELEQLQALNDQITSEIRDLEYLLNGCHEQMSSVRYKMEYMAFSKQSARLKEKLIKASREKNRNESLFREQLISEKEFDDMSFTEDQHRQELNNFIFMKRNQWQNELAELQFRQKQYKGQINCLNEDLKHWQIRSPIPGTIEYLSPIHPGSNIQVGQQLAVISPDTAIIGEIYIPPSDIGLIHLGQPVQLIIDAFDYREWGTIQAAITEISDDFLVINNQPVFRIRCKLDRITLQLKNGYTGSLKKGMTFQALCLVNRKSVWQLLTGKMNKWLNPALASSH
jgi:multidrug resistance efflux pump